MFKHFIISINTFTIKTQSANHFPFEFLVTALSSSARNNGPRVLVWPCSIPHTHYCVPCPAWPRHLPPPPCCGRLVQYSPSLPPPVCSSSSNRLRCAAAALPTHSWWSFWPLLIGSRGARWPGCAHCRVLRCRPLGHCALLLLLSPQSVLDTVAVRSLASNRDTRH